MEQEAVGWDGEQRLGKFLDLGQQKIVDILRRKNERGLLFPHAFHAVSDVLDCRHIGQKEVQFVHGSNCISLAQKLIAHKAENVEQQRIFQPLVGVHKTFYAETNKFAVAYICVTVKIF